MQTTINLPDDLHRRVMSLAKDTNKTLSEAFVDLVRRGLGQPASIVAVTVDADTGLPQIELGDVVTTDEVRSLMDDD
jgi:predicted transcriptional regulator